MRISFACGRITSTRTLAALSSPCRRGGGRRGGSTGDADGEETAAPKRLPVQDQSLSAFASNGTTFLLGQFEGLWLFAPDGTVLRSGPIESAKYQSPVWVLPNGDFQFVVLRSCNGACF